MATTMRAKDDEAAIAATVYGLMAFGQGMSKYPQPSSQLTARFYLLWAGLTALAVGLPGLVIVCVLGLDGNVANAWIGLTAAVLTFPVIYLLWFFLPGRYMRWRHRRELKPLVEAIERHAVTRPEFEEAVLRSPIECRTWIRYGLKGRLLALCRESGVEPPRS